MPNGLFEELKNGPSAIAELRFAELFVLRFMRQTNTDTTARQKTNSLKKNWVAPRERIAKGGPPWVTQRDTCGALFNKSDTTLCLDRPIFKRQRPMFVR